MEEHYQTVASTTHTKNFQFGGVYPIQFYRFQWIKNRGFFMIYRMLLAIFDVICMISGYTAGLKKDFWQSLSNWTEAVACIYFCFAAAVSVHGFKKHQEHLIKETRLFWFHKWNWVLFTISTTSSFMVTVLFWFFLTPFLDQGKLSALDFRKHGGQLFILVIDTLMVAFPVRLFHATHEMIFMFTWCLMTVVLYIFGIKSKFHKRFDFQQSQNITLIYLGVMTFVNPIFVQMVFFRLYKLKCLIFKPPDFSALDAITTEKESTRDTSKDDRSVSVKASFLTHLTQFTLDPTELKEESLLSDTDDSQSTQSTQVYADKETS